MGVVVFMQMQSEGKAAGLDESLQRLDMRNVVVLECPVQVAPLFIRSGVVLKSPRIQAWEDKAGQVAQERDVAFGPAHQRFRARRFIAMDSRRNINSGRWRVAPDFRLTVQRQPFEPVSFVKDFRSPAVPLRRRRHVAQHDVNINRLAVVTAVIFAELLHAENFTPP